MPQRNERLFWVYTEPVDGSLAAQIDAANQSFALSAGVASISCVQTRGVSARLWLLQLPTTDQSVARNFNGQLLSHLQSLGSRVGYPQLRVKRQTNLPQPLVHPRLGPWPKTDLGLHSVNDQYNGMLVSYTYHEGRYYHIPHLQLSTLQQVSSALGAAWQAVVCNCYQSVSGCCGVGCFECFQLNCSNCDGTGWKGFAAWAQRGYPVDYSLGIPMAL
jgi:hypothetical protein